MKAADACLVITNLPDRDSAARLAPDLFAKRRAPARRAANAGEVREPDKAFRFSARALDATTVEVSYAIADGYYLYRERFRFAAEPATVRFGEPQFSKGQIHEDKFFGKQETYRKDVRIRLPLEAGGAERLKLLVTSQGCADLGVCY